MKLLYSIIFPLLIAQQSYAANWSFPAPKGAKVEWAANDTQFNGISIKGRHFTSDQSVEEILQFYRYLWDGAVAETDYPPWKMISHKQDTLLYTVQVQASDKGSVGILGVSDIAEKLKPENRQVLANKFPKMNGSMVQNDMQMSDPGSKSQNIFLTNQFSVMSNVNYYKQYFESRNWSLDSDHQLGFSAPHMLIFKKGRDQVNLVISRKDGKTNIVANTVTRNLLSW